jgi:limonene-1,2-epoxide hydrolase
VSAAFRAAVESRDIDAAIELLAPDVVFRSPVVFSPYEGRDAVAALLRAVVEVFEDFGYDAEIESEDRSVLLFHARIGDKSVEGADFLRFGADGLVEEFIVMVRPMSGMLALAEAMRARLEAAGAI